MKGKEIENIEIIKIPLFRKLVSLVGEEIEIEQQLQKIAEDIQESKIQLEAWIEILIQSEKTRPDIYHYYNDLVKDLPIKILKVNYTHSYLAIDGLESDLELDHLEPIDIFKKRCEAAGFDSKQTQKSIKDFKELMDWMRDLKNE